MLFAAKVTVPAAALMLAKNNADPEKQANVEEGYGHTYAICQPRVCAAGNLRCPTDASNSPAIR